MTTTDDRRARHPEVDWRQPVTFTTEDVPPRRRGRPRFDPPICTCGCSSGWHDMDTGECTRCGCEMWDGVPS